MAEATIRTKYKILRVMLRNHKNATILKNNSQRIILYQEKRDDNCLLKKSQKEREKAYRHLKELIKEVDLTELTEADKYFLQILEGLIEISKITGDNIDNLYAATLAQDERLAVLESEMKKLREKRP